MRVVIMQLSSKVYYKYIQNIVFSRLVKTYFMWAQCSLYSVSILSSLVKLDCYHIEA